jgi:very-short-patch-repair endonuclease
MEKSNDPYRPLPFQERGQEGCVTTLSQHRVRRSTSRFSRTPQATARSRVLRRNMTEAEKKLWSLLRLSQLGGYRFRRQHPIGRYIADFYCPTLKVVVELDGGQHADERQKLQDRTRSSWLQSKQIQVLRFWNSDVLSNPDGVLRSIAICLSARTNNDPHPTSPFQGEEKSKS